MFWTSSPESKHDFMVIVAVWIAHIIIHNHVLALDTLVNLSNWNRAKHGLAIGKLHIKLQDLAQWNWEVLPARKRHQIKSSGVLISLESHFHFIFPANKHNPQHSWPRKSNPGAAKRHHIAPLPYTSSFLTRLFVEPHASRCFPVAICPALNAKRTSLSPPLSSSSCSRVFASATSQTACLWRRSLSLLAKAVLVCTGPLVLI